MLCVFACVSIDTYAQAGRLFLGSAAFSAFRTDPRTGNFRPKKQPFGGTVGAMRRSGDGSPSSTGTLLLHVQRALHRGVDAVEHDHHRVATRVHDLPAERADRRIDQRAPQRAGIIHADKPAVTGHVGMNDTRRRLR